MRLDDYLKEINEDPCPWAKKHKIPISCVTRFLREERGLSVKTIKKIIDATGGKVSWDDLVKDEGGAKSSPLEVPLSHRVQDKGNGTPETIRKIPSFIRGFFFFGRKSDK